MKNTRSKVVANVIKKERRTQKLSQDDISKLLGINRRKYQRLENEGNMRVSDMEDIFKVLGLELSVVKVQKEIKLI